MAYQFPVINPYYCVPHSLNLQMNTEKGVTYDINGNRVFYIKDTFFTLHDRRVLYDDRGNPIVTLYNKIMTLSGRWNVFRGKSSDSSQLLFSMKRSSSSGNSMILEVFLAKNTSESVCDFRVNVCRGKTSCIVYAGESPTIVATMENNGGFNVWVYPNVDYAFIVALLMIINEMEDYEELMNLASEITTTFLVAS